MIGRGSSAAGIGSAIHMVEITPIMPINHKIRNRIVLEIMLGKTYEIDSDDPLTDNLKIIVFILSTSSRRNNKRQSLSEGVARGNGSWLKEWETEERFLTSLRGTDCITLVLDRSP
jgi:hypothetical protein